MAMTGRQWTETWDSTQSLGQGKRLPLQVRIILVLKGGVRNRGGGGRQTVRLVSKIPIQVPKALTFATQ